jgi:integrase
MVRGHRYSFTLDVKSEGEALAELASFLRDPVAYSGLQAIQRATVAVLGPVIIGAYVAHMEEKLRSQEWVKWQRACLRWWHGRLGSVALAGLTIASVAPHLRRGDGRDIPGARHRREALKAICSWCAKTGRIEGQSPLAAWPVGSLAPAQWARSKVIPEPAVVAIGQKLPAPWCWAWSLQAATGWHTSEVWRFAASGEVDPCAGTCTTRHKSGKPHSTRVPPSVMDGARRLRASGVGVADQRPRLYAEAVKVAARGLGLPDYRAGWLRHTLATSALERGHTAEAVGAFLGHASGAMVRRVYGVTAAPPSVLGEPAPKLPRRSRGAAISQGG